MIHKLTSSLAAALTLLFFTNPLQATVVISTQPQPVNVLAGDVAVFTVNATGTGTLTYQWKRDGNAIAGATNAGLVINPVLATNAGSYTVDVSDTTSSIVTSSDATLSLRSPAPGDVDFSFAGGAPINSTVRAITFQSDGKVLISGYFTLVNGAARGCIARLNPDGSTDYTFGNGMAGANSPVNAMAIQSDGKVLISGGFTTVNGTACGSIARLNSDGTLDTSFGNGLNGANKPISAMILQNDGKVLIGGSFTNVNDTMINRIARLNPDGTLDTSFGNSLAGANGSVSAVAIQSDGKVLISGGFTTVNGTARGGIARLNPDGTLDATFGNGLTGIFGSIGAMALQSDGKVLIGGDFNSVNGTARKAIARLNPDGTLDTAFGNGLAGAKGIVSSVALQTDGKVVIGGNFTSVNGMPVNRIARLNSDGTLDATFVGNGPSGVNDLVASVALQSDGKIIIGGEFLTVNDMPISRVARLNDDGTLDTTFGNGVTGAGVTVASGVGAITLQNDGKALIGGNFTAFNGVKRTGIARLNTDGTLDGTFGNVLTGVNDGVAAIALQSDGKVLIGGRFTNLVNGTLLSNIARLNSDGTLDTSFGSGVTGANNTVSAITPQSDGKVFIGGSFTTVNGTARSCIARLNSDGTLDASFANGLTGADNTVTVIALQNDGKVLIGGRFANVNGTGRGCIARLNPDGTLDNTFGSGLAGAVQTYSPVSSGVSDIALQNDDKVLIGGFFTTVNGTTRSGIARLNSDGTLDTTFNGVATLYAAYSMALQSDGKVLIGGAFWFNGIPVDRVARLNSDGTLDTTFANGQADVENEVDAMALQSDGKVIIGGYFSTVNGLPRKNIARLWGPAASSNAALATLTLGNGTLSPAFDANTLNYTVAMPNAVTSLTITPTTSDTNATVIVNGASAATPVPLHLGTNLINILVIAQDGVTTDNYSLTIIVPTPPTLYISTLNNVVTLYWQNAPGWNLQETTTLPAASTNWSYSQGVTSIGSTNYLTLTNAPDNRFYRLSFP